MLNTRTLGWGRITEKPCKRAWGARLIYPADIVHDRCQWLVEGDDRLPDGSLNREKIEPFGNAVNAVLGKLRDRQVLFQHFPDGARSDEVWEGEVPGHPGVFFEASPNGSHGYLYLTVWEGVEEPSKEEA